MARNDKNVGKILYRSPQIKEKRQVKVLIEGNPVQTTTEVVKNCLLFEEDRQGKNFDT